MKKKSIYQKLLEAINNQLNEITREKLRGTKLQTYISKKEDATTQLNHIFEGENRILIPFNTGANYTGRDAEMIEYINRLRNEGWTIDFNEPFGYATKIVKSEYGGKTFETKRKERLGPLFAKMGREASEFWQKHNKFYTTKENEFYFNKKYTIIISRVPMDILRMSDHDGWSSCHGTHGSYFKCAVSEAVDGGAIAYIVNNDDVQGLDLTKEEIFADWERQVSGIKPISRLRIRRFVGTDKYQGIELGIPEQRVYGQSFEGFYEAIASFVQQKQAGMTSKLKDVVSKSRDPVVRLDYFFLTGGSYQDHPGRELFEEFYGSEFKFKYETSYKSSTVEFQEAQERVEEIVENFNNTNDHASLSADVDVGEEQIIVNATARFVIGFNEAVDVNKAKAVENLIQDKLIDFKYMFRGDMSVEYFEKEPGKYFPEFRFLMELDEDYSNDIDGLDLFARELSYIDEQYNSALSVIKSAYVTYGVIENEYLEKIKNLNLNNFQKTELKGELISAKLKEIRFVSNFEKIKDQIVNQQPPEEREKISNLIYNNDPNITYVIRRDYLEEAILNVTSEIEDNFLNGKPFTLKQPDLFLFQKQNKSDLQLNSYKLSDFNISFYIQLGAGSNYYFKPLAEYDDGEEQMIGGSGKTDKDKNREIFIKLLTYLNNNYSQIFQSFKLIVAQAEEMRKEKMLEIVESIKSGQRKSPYEYPDRRQQQLNLAEERKLFKLDGATWRMIK